MLAFLITTWLEGFEKEAGYIYSSLPTLATGSERSRTMTEQVYDPKEFALSLGFSEADAELFEGVNADATNLRRIAETRYAKGKMVNPKAKPLSKTAQMKAEKEAAKVRAAERAEAEAKAELEAAEQKAREADEEEAAKTPEYPGEGGGNVTALPPVVDYH